MSLRKRRSLPCYDLSVVYDIAFKYELTEVLDDLIENGLKTHCDEKYRENFENRKPKGLIGAEAAFVYNRPNILDCVIPPIAGKTNQMRRDRLVFICIALRRAECRKVLLKYGFPENENLTDDDKQNELFHILLSFSCCRKEIVSLIQGFKKIELPHIVDGVRHDHHVILRCLWKLFCYKRVNSGEFVQLMALGEDIDLSKLKIVHLEDIYRELVESCLFSNLSNLNSLAEQTVNIYLKHYHKTDLQIRESDIDLIFKESNVAGKTGGEFTMDAHEHFLFNEKDFALNFILPLFIECGFPLKRKLIDSILHDEGMVEKLHPAETEYLRKSLVCPRSL